MIDPRRPVVPGAQIVRSQLAVEIALTAYAIFAAMVVLRLVLLIIGIDPRLWVGSVIYGLTDPILFFLLVVPGTDHRLLGGASLADLTALGIVILVPIALLLGSKPDAATG